MSNHCLHNTASFNLIEVTFQYYLSSIDLYTFYISLRYTHPYNTKSSHSTHSKQFSVSTMQFCQTHAQRSQECSWSSQTLVQIFFTYPLTNNKVKQFITNARGLDSGICWPRILSSLYSIYNPLNQVLTFLNISMMRYNGGFGFRFVILL